MDPGRGLWVHCITRCPSTVKPGTVENASFVWNRRGPLVLHGELVGACGWTVALWGLTFVRRRRGIRLVGLVELEGGAEGRGGLAQCLG